MTPDVPRGPVGPDPFAGPLVGWTLGLGAAVGISVGTLAGYPGPGLAVGVFAGLMIGAGIKVLLRRRRDR